MKLLVTGGAGYVGSVVTAQLLAAGHQVIVLDDLSTGHADAVPDGARLVVGTLREAAASVLDGADIEAVLHFAARSLVGESMEHPGLYWDRNLGESLALFEAMRGAGVSRVVFSSTAATYGEPEVSPIVESAPTRPTNPYGASKLAIDTVLTEYARLHGLGGVSLRYFNVAGAHRDAGGSGTAVGANGANGANGNGVPSYGERHTVETHLIPIVLQVAAGDRASVSIHGTDYPTPDGTCLRDYIHVTDLGRAHLLALEACRAGEHEIFNLGSGDGSSVQEVIEVCREVTGHPIPAIVGPRRPGDPAVLVASAAKIRERLGWAPQHGLRDMVTDAWSFARARAARAGSATPGTSENPGTASAAPSDTSGRNR